jgi:hypothetical protein
MGGFYRVDHGKAVKSFQITQSPNNSMPYFLRSSSLNMYLMAGL